MEKERADRIFADSPEGIAAARAEAAKAAIAAMEKERADRIFADSPEGIAAARAEAAEAAVAAMEAERAARIFADSPEGIAAARAEAAAAADKAMEKERARRSEDWAERKAATEAWGKTLAGQLAEHVMRRAQEIVAHDNASPAA